VEARSPATLEMTNCATDTLTARRFTIESMKLKGKLPLLLSLGHPFVVWLPEYPIDIAQSECYNSP